MFRNQPTLSMQIKKLEDELGVIIFDRSRQPVVPTDLGAKLIEQARMTLSATQRIKEIIQEEQQEVEGTLKIGIYRHWLLTCYRFSSGPISANIRQ